MSKVPKLTDKLCRILGHIHLPGVTVFFGKARRLNRSVDTEFFCRG